MAFGLYIEFENSLDINTIHERIIQISKGLIEIFPIETGAQFCGLGLAISSKQLGDPIWWELKSILSYFFSLGHCRVFELYNGKEIKAESLLGLKALIGT